MEMICENANKCIVDCDHLKFHHNKKSLGPLNACKNKCTGEISGSIEGSICIPLKLFKLRKIGL